MKRGEEGYLCGNQPQLGNLSLSGSWINLMSCAGFGLIIFSDQAIIDVGYII